MPEMVGFSNASRQARPRALPQRDHARPDAAPVGMEADVRRMLGDRMRIRKTTVIPQPNWLLVGAVLLAVAMSLGIGIGVGGGLVAIGVGLGWMSVALVALVWSELGRVYHYLQNQD